MGTRSTTKIYDVYHHIDEDGEEEVEKLNCMNLYKQYDGYHDGWGEQLKDFIKKGRFVNGIPGVEQGNTIYFNGAGCFACRLVKEFKERAGGLYGTNEENSQEYNYVIEFHYKNNSPQYIILMESDTVLLKVPAKDKKLTEVV